MKSLFALAAQVYTEQQDNSPPAIWKKIPPIYENYDEKQKVIKSALENLVR
jgi:hypothetical protein